MISRLNKLLVTQFPSVLLSKQLSLYQYSIKNYMKTYEVENIDRPHGLFRVDQNKILTQDNNNNKVIVVNNDENESNYVDRNNNIDINNKQLKQLIQKQQLTYTNLSKLWQSRTQSYYSSCSARRDIRVNSVQQKFDNYLYFTKVAYHESRQYTTIHRKAISSSKQQVVLDIMQYYPLRKYHKTIQLTKTSFSESHRYVAFGYDLNNNQTIRYMIKDTKENKILGVKYWKDNVLEQVSNVIWYKDQGLFYVKTQQRRPCKVYYQDVDGEAVLIYQQKDKEYWVDVTITKDKKYLVINKSNKSHSKITAINLTPDNNNKHKFNSKYFKQHSIQYTNTQQIQQIHLNHCSDYMIIWRQKETTNTISIRQDENKNESHNNANNNVNNNVNMINKNMISNKNNNNNMNKNNRSKQKIIHQLAYDEKLTDMDIFYNKIVLYIQKNTQPIMRIIHIKSTDSQESKNKQHTQLDNLPYFIQIQQPALPYQIGKITPGSNQTYNSSSCIFYISTPFIYNQGYCYNFQSHSFAVIQRFQLTGPKFNYDKYQIKTIQIPSLSGELIPLTIISSKQSKFTKRHPRKLILKVYGFYGLSNQVTYDNMNYPLLEKSYVICYAHVRGGGEKGKQWHLQAVKNHNIRWSDLEDCVSYLIREKYTHPSLLFLHSHSAGAITVFNAMNKSPHLYKAVIMSYPFLDVLNILQDQSDILSHSDHNQFGNPLQSKQNYRKIESISPYQNIQAKPYPFIFMIGGMKDYRCDIKQLLKFIARYRQRVKMNNRYENIVDKGILLKIEENSSHLGAADISEENYNQCEVYAMLDYLVEQASNECKYEKQ